MHEITREDVDRARRIARGYAGRDDDVESAAMLALYRASRTWRGVGTFQGFAAEHVRFACLREVRRTKPEPVDLETLPDTTVVVGALDDADAERHAALHEALEDLGVVFLLDGVDRRRFAHRGALVALARRLT